LNGKPDENPNGKLPVFVLLGPTAAGKTASLFDLFGGSDAVAPAEVISADSMQVYRGMDIGTAKPDGAARAALPPHLIDLCDPGDQFNAGDFVRLAGECCAEIYAKGKLPVMAGGSGFYLKNFIQGLPDSPPGNEAIRQQLKLDAAGASLGGLVTGEGGLSPCGGARAFTSPKEAPGHATGSRKGPSALYAELQKGDPAAASRIHPNDTYRVIRALEVLRLTGKPLSAFEAASREKKEARARRYAFLVVALTRNREELYARINARVDAMFARGLPEEARVLFAKGWTPDDPGMRAIGYREFFVALGENAGAAGLRGEAPPRWAFTSDIEGAREMIKRNSRRYAKRQETFFRGMEIEPARRFLIEGAGEARVQASLRALVKDFWDARHA
jgi:tRNA dimethylallyltransferase